jgi:hypothetical protein
VTGFLWRGEDRLARQDRAGTYAALRAQRMRRTFARDSWWQLVVLVILVMTPAAALLPFQHSDLARGLTVGFAAGAAVVGGISFVVFASGSASITLGAWAEQWTSESLRKMRPHGYHLINGARIGYGDIDHVLVGPGGVLVFETKWSAYDWSLEHDPYVARAMRQVNEQADRLKRWLRLEHDVDRVVVLWGAAAGAVDNKAERMQRAKEGGPLIIAGGALEGWLLRLPRNRMTADEAQALSRRIAQQTDARDAYETPNAPPSIWALIGSSAVALWVAVYLPVGVAALLDDLGAVISAAAVGAAAWFLRRNARFRLPSTIALSVSGLWVLLFIADRVIH